MKAFFQRLAYYFTFETKHLGPAAAKLIESEFFTGIGIIIAIFLKMADDRVFAAAPFGPAIHVWLANNLQPFLLAQYVIPFGRAVQGWVQSKQQAAK